MGSCQLGLEASVHMGEESHLQDLMSHMGVTQIPWFLRKTRDDGIIFFVVQCLRDLLNRFGGLHEKKDKHFSKEEPSCEWAFHNAWENGSWFMRHFHGNCRQPQAPWWWPVCNRMKASWLIYISEHIPALTSLKDYWNVRRAEGSNPGWLLLLKAWSPGPSGSSTVSEMRIHRQLCLLSQQLSDWHPRDLKVWPHSLQWSDVVSNSGLPGSAHFCFFLLWFTYRCK